MKIKICSAEAAANELKDDRGTIHVISIRDTKYVMGNTPHPVTACESFAKKMLIKEFDDISHEKYEAMGLVACKREDILDIFDWVDKEDPKKLMVHCWAGVSRSSAVAYLIFYRKYGVKKANRIIDKRLHRPNSLILDLGMSILKGY